MRLTQLTIVTMLALALAACGAAPQTAAPQAPTGDADTLVATAVPAATAVPPINTVPSATPQETVMPDEPTATPPQPAPTRTARPLPPVAPVVPTPDAAPVTGETPADLLDKIKQDAAQRSGVDVAALVVERDEAVEWNDGALGCPQPGVAYLQVITPGYHVVLHAGDTTYDYRATDRGSFMLCEK